MPAAHLLILLHSLSPVGVIAVLNILLQKYRPKQTTSTAKIALHFLPVLLLLTGCRLRRVYVHGIIQPLFCSTSLARIYSHCNVNRHSRCTAFENLTALIRIDLVSGNKAGDAITGLVGTEDKEEEKRALHRAEDLQQEEM